MPKNGYIINKSNYSYRKLHANTSNGNVYVRDFMTTLNLGGWDSGTIPNSENGFKMVENYNNGAPRSHRYGSWILNGESDFWDLKSTNITGVTSESEIKLKPNYGSLLDFAYFGSSTELLRVSVGNIINNFPAELCFTGNKIEIGFQSVGGGNPESIYLGSENFYYEVSNPLYIDLIKKITDNEENVINLLRYMMSNYMRYYVYEENESGLTNNGCINTYKINEENAICDYENNVWDYEVILKAEDGDEIKIRRYYYNHKVFYLTNTDTKYHIRLSDADIQDFYDNLDDFERMLMDTSTNPKYKVRVDYPHEGEDGFLYTYKKTIYWPTTDGWNIDIESNAYSNYINSLLEICEFYDNRNTDNMWRMMTHDAIKNMDTTFFKNNDFDEEEYEYGKTKIKSLIRCYGRQFDDIKRYIENISYTNNITYSGYNNLPDYFLTDTLNLGGWEVCSAVKGLKIGGTNRVNNLFPGDIGDYNENNANTIFLRNLKLNSKDILLRKGTRYGIEMILGMFGYRSDDFMGALSGISGDYSIDERVFVNEYKNEPTSGMSLPIEMYNDMRRNFVSDTDEMGSDYDTLMGLPAIVFEYDITESGKTVTYRTVIPWFKEPSELDSAPYFQMYGGWGKISDKSGETYTETIRYLNIVATLDDLKTKNDVVGGEIYYVYDVSDYKDYSGLTEDEHYFTISAENIENYRIVGIKGSLTGWLPLSNDNANVIYLESIFDDYEGNNPHLGYAGYFDDYKEKYDDGEDYIERFRKLFKGTIEADLLTEEAYNCSTGEPIDGIKGEGFDIIEYIDNMKTWYFYDKSRENKNSGLFRLKKNDDGTYEPLTYDYEYNGVGSEFCDENSSLYSSDLTPIDIRKGYSGASENEVHASYSVMNSKVLEITFHTNSDEEGKYIKASVLPYLCQMIPTTTILKINL